jgi:hypothetical protein
LNLYYPISDPIRSDPMEPINGRRTCMNGPSDLSQLETETHVGASILNTRMSTHTSTLK